MVFVYQPKLSSGAFAVTGRSSDAKVTCIVAWGSSRGDRAVIQPPRDLSVLLGLERGDAGSAQVNVVACRCWIAAGVGRLLLVLGLLLPVDVRPGRAVVVVEWHGGSDGGSDRREGGRSICGRGEKGFGGVGGSNSRGPNARDNLSGNERAV